MSSKRMEELEKLIAELKSRWPAHSVPPTMLQQLDDLEDELEQARIDEIRSKKATEEKSSAKAEGRGGL